MVPMVLELLLGLGESPTASCGQGANQELEEEKREGELIALRRVGSVRNGGTS